NAICASFACSTPWMRLRVVCGLCETIATFCPISALSSDDLPTLGRPTMATMPLRIGVLQQHQQFLGRRLLRRATAGAVRIGRQRRVAQHAAHMEFAPMRGTGFGEHLVQRQRTALPLQEFLQARLGVLERLSLGQLRERGAIQVQASLARRVEAAVEIDRADQRFERISEDRGAPEAAALELAGAELERLTKIERLGDADEAVFANQARSEPGEIAFG